MTEGLASMTGYARASGALPGYSILVEIRSVNARGLDVRLRLPPGLDALEPELRRRIGARLVRGAVTCTLAAEREGAGGDVVVNSRALETVLNAIAALDKGHRFSPPRIDGILALKGVLEQRDAPLDPEAGEALNTALLAAADMALQNLSAARRREGAMLAAALTGRIDEIAALTARAAAHPARSREAILEKLRRQVAELVAAGPGLGEERLMQEAMLLATRADIKEEIDRLDAHVAAARALVAAGGPVGRKLDFLAQEFNREANTLCSKSNAVDLTAIGLDLKTAIDQLREQVQNIE
jgi:uncharacterized protein (TIGR00255 family)